MAEIQTGKQPDFRTAMTEVLYEILQERTCADWEFLQDKLVPFEYILANGDDHPISLGLGAMTLGDCRKIADKLFLAFMAWRRGEAEREG